MIEHNSGAVLQGDVLEGYSNNYLGIWWGIIRVKVAHLEAVKERYEGIFWTGKQKITSLISLVHNR